MDDSANFAATGTSYQHYAEAAKQINTLGHDAVIEEFISSNLWGTPDMILATLRHRREVIGDFEVNGAFSYYSLPYEDVEQNSACSPKKSRQRSRAGSRKLVVSPSRSVLRLQLRRSKESRWLTPYFEEYGVPQASVNANSSTERREIGPCPRRTG